jgi:hypothetical protein
MDYKVDGKDWARLRPKQAREAVPKSGPVSIREASAEEFTKRISIKTIT